MTVPAEEVLYESPQPTLGHKIVVAFGTGVGLAALTAFTLWAPHPERTLTNVAGVAGLAGVLGFAAIVAAIFVGRTTRRVAVDRPGRALVLHRDPNRVERFPLATLRAITCEPTVGGWSRDPSERLVVTLDGGRVLRCELPDDADTPGIVRDLELLRADPDAALTQPSSG